ncbi:uncharacterized protein [Macaca fascicularis]|uniref:uncharacterized protein n=1 Tax=Macaca fascicularis TaxID=9541 RepID=UPI0032B03E3E
MDSWLLVHCHSLPPSSMSSIFSWWRQALLHVPTGASGAGTALAAYNLGLVVLLGCLWEVMATPLLANCSYFCQPVDYRWSEHGMRASFCRQVGTVESAVHRTVRIWG